VSLLTEVQMAVLGENRPEGVIICHGRRQN